MDARRFPESAVSCHGLGKRPEHEFFRVAVVATQQRGGGIEPVAMFGDKPFRAAFGVLRDFLPDFHLSSGRERPQ